MGVRGGEARRIGQDACVTSSAEGVTFVIPVLNGARTLKRSLSSILAQRDERPFEIIAIDDGSLDRSLRLLTKLQGDGTLRLIYGDGRGAAAAINAGIREAAHPIICQIDQDVILRSNWLAQVLEHLDDPDVAAVQGHYITAPGAGFWARATGRDLEHRYSRIRGRLVDHVCTGNTAYRARALHHVGLLDERLGYGYDNDLSYRLQQAGYRLAFCRPSISVHMWREGLQGYLRQQFGVGYGRLDVIARHPRRVTGDDVSGTMMMLHAPAMLMALTSCVVAGAVATVGGAWIPWLLTALAIGAVLSVERLCAGVQGWRRTGDRAALAFAVTHLVRDVAWSAAIIVWFARWIFRRERGPAHSMLPHPRINGRSPALCADAVSLLAVVPAYNERANLTRVVADLSRVISTDNILIVNDGSTDGTEDLLPMLGVRWLTLSQRLGVGGAVRAGIEYAKRNGYHYVVRVDGDGQHRACDIARMLAPVAAGRADATLGSRFLHRRPGATRLRRLSQALLAAGLSTVTRRRVTDPTSGFWLFGPRALRMLSGHHPPGYAEPELLLFLNRNGLCVTEVPIRMRPRLAGRTSLTTTRTMIALARTILAFVVVPFRQMVEGQAHD
jgi:glycosyltransferase involved in cell wall biosynthesis